MSTDLVAKYSLGTTLEDILSNSVKVYTNVVGSSVKSESQVTRESVLRNQLQADPEHVQTATVMTREFFSKIVDCLADSPLTAPAMYQALVELAKRIKDIRDDYVTDAVLGTTKREIKLNIPYEDLKGLRELIDSLFASCSLMGKVPSGFPIKITAAGNSTPDIPKLPAENGRDTSTSYAIKSFLIWEVDGEVYQAISPRKLAREILSTARNPVSTGEIWEAFGHRDQLLDGKRHSAVINGKTVTCWNGSAK